MLLILPKNSTPYRPIVCLFSFFLILVLGASCTDQPISQVNSEVIQCSVDSTIRTNNLNYDIKLARARRCQEQCAFKEASQRYAALVRLRDSLEHVHLALQSMEIKHSNSLMDAQLATAKMQRKLDDRKNVILSVSTIALNTIGTLLLVLLIYYIHHHNHLHKYNIKLKAALNRAQEGISVKENFMHFISAEIGKPVNRMMSSFNQLEDIHPEDEEMRQYLAIINENERKLSDVVSGILNVSDLHNKILDEPHIIYNINQLIRDVIEKYRPRLHGEVDICFTSSLPIRFTMSLRYHAASLLLEALVSNAVKYTNKGVIRLHSCFDESKDCLIVTVEDTGVGIREDDADKIFDLFFKGDGYELGGGAGLFIAQQIAHGRKGTLLLDQEYKDGARFVLTIPITTRPYPLKV
ncbi:MAG: HAMP domain-containing sensor histidine kinase [Bacteroidaceae bacterium]